MKIDDKNKLLIIISAPSGAGKTSICKNVLKKIKNLVYCVSYTTRSKRLNEIHGIDYKFIEWNKVYGNLYGICKSDLNLLIKSNKDIILDIDIKGARKLKKIFPQGIYIFIIPPSLQELKKRLTSRKSETKENIKIRLNNICKEIKEALWYDYFICNENLFFAIKQLESIYFSEKCKIQRIKKQLKKIIKELI